MNSRDKKFLALQAKWDKKLKDSGFEDIEQRDGNLKRWSLDKTVFQRERDSAKEEYYRLAGHFLYDHEFESEKDRKVWELHAEGNSLNTIIHKLRELGVKTAYREEPHAIVRKLSEIMSKQWKLPKKA